MKSAVIFFCMAFTGVSFADQMPAINPPEVTKNKIPQHIQKKHITKTAAFHPQEWILHKTLTGDHPNNEEQRMVWLMNRARQNPRAEGLFLANIDNLDIKNAIDYFRVDINKMKAEFADYVPRPPAAFDIRLYRAALAHSKDQISRDTQDHYKQVNRINDSGFHFMYANLSVFSYAKNGFYAHAGFNIDWGNEADGMQLERGHRVGLMSIGDRRILSNVGIAAVPEHKADTRVGPLVVTANYAHADDSFANHYNKFIVGTVWRDKNQNNMYDIGEGLGDVQVRPHHGAFWAKTSKSGGYAIPVTNDNINKVSFFGGQLKAIRHTVSVAIKDDNVLLDLKL